MTEYDIFYRNKLLWIWQRNHNITKFSFTKLSPFQVYIHSKLFLSPGHDKLNGAKIPAATILYACLGGLSMIIAMIVHFCYNRFVMLHSLYIYIYILLLFPFFFSFFKYKCFDMCELAQNLRFSTHDIITIFLVLQSFSIASLSLQYQTVYGLFIL